MNEIIILAIVLLVFYFFFSRKESSKKSKQISEKRKKELDRLFFEKQQEIEHDKECVTKKQIRSILIGLNLPSFVIGLFDETEDLKKHDFYDTFIPPYHIINLTKKGQDFFEIDRYIPLFETMDDFLEVLAYDFVLKGFIRYCPEDNTPLKNCEVLNWNGIFVEQILTWY